MTTREALHAIVDRLPESALPTAEQSLRELDDPLLRALAAAPEDDEPLSEAHAARLDAAIARMRAGRRTPHAEVKRRLGL